MNSRTALISASISVLACFLLVSALYYVNSFHRRTAQLKDEDAGAENILSPARERNAEGAGVPGGGKKSRRVSISSAEGPSNSHSDLKTGRGESVSGKRRRTPPITRQPILPADEVTARSEVEIRRHAEQVGDTATVIGSLVDREGHGIVGETVYLQSRSMDVLFDSTTASDGDFQLVDVPVGNDYRLWVHPKTDYRDKTIDSLRIQPGENRLEVLLDWNEEGILDATLVDADGKPLSLFTVRIRSAQSQRESVTATSDERGRLRVEGVPSGSVIIETKELPRVTVSGLNIDPFDENTVEIPIGVGKNTVEGSVLSREGVPVAGAQIGITWSEKRGSLNTSLHQKTVTDAEGYFRVERFGSGACSMSVTATGYRPERTTFQVSPAARPLRLQLEVRPEEEETRGS